MKLFSIKSFIVFVILLVIPVTAEACTGIYVGKKVSSDGSVMIARTEDMTSYNSKRFVIHPARDHDDGDMFSDAFGLSIEYPSHTYRYSALPSSATRNMGEAPYGAAGFNEMGVAATSTITAYPSEKVLNADPFVKGGLYELSANDIILSTAKSARDGIEIIADIVDRYGSSEGNIIMVADNDEAWYMEILSGHQYAAIKLPEDMAAVIPNAYMLEAIDVQSDDVICSKDLISLPEKNGFIVKEGDLINIRATYAEEMKNTNKIRIWGGKRKLYGDTGNNPYASQYSLFFKPSKKISVKDVMEVTRYRYEDTPYNVNLPENKYVRAIGISRQEECHVLQLRDSMPIEVGCVEWLCMSNSEFSPYVPYYTVAMTRTPESYAIDAPEYNPNSMYWASRSLATLCALNRNKYGNKVHEYYNEYENNLIKYLNDTDKLMLSAQNKSDKANNIADALALDLINKSHEMYKQVIAYLARFEGEDEYEKNTYTFSPTLTYGINTEIKDSDCANNDAVEYKDISEDFWAYNNIIKMTQMGIFSGYSDQTFRPENEITHEEFVKSIVSIICNDTDEKCNIENEASAEYWNNRWAAWAQPYLNKAINEKIVDSDDMSLGAVEKPITREEMSSVIMGAYRYAIQNKSDFTKKSIEAFSDYNLIADRYKISMKEVYSLGIINGYNDNTIAPTKCLNRAEAAAVLMRLIDAKENK